MNTAHDVIRAFIDLPDDEREEVRNFVNSNNHDVDFLIKAFDEKYVEQEDYSPEDIAKLDRLQEDAEKGINMSPVYKTKEEALAHLDRLEEESS